MFGSADFPKFKYGNTITDVDPQWNDADIYVHEAAFVKWTRPASYIHALGQPAGNYPPATAWDQWWWIPSGDLSNNSVWPVFDGTYKNAQTLKGALEMNVPLGDLNWYPQAKAAWSAHIPEIWAHIKAGNTNQLDIGFAGLGAPAVEMPALSVYPNPANNVLFVNGATNAAVTISTVDGRLVKAVKNVTQVNISDLPNGMYFVTIKDGENVSAPQKVLVVR